MKIKKKLEQFRRDFTAIMVCEHCGTEELLTTGYDDTNYHVNVIPKMKCPKCGLTSPEGYTPMSTEYPDGMVI